MALLALSAGCASSQGRALFLREQGSVLEPPAGSLVPPAPTEPPDAGADRAREALSAAQEAYLLTSFSACVDTVRAVASSAAHTLVRTEPSLVVELELWAGACDLLAGNRDSARQAFRRALGLRPEAELPAGLPPEVVAAFEAVAREARGQLPSSRTLTSDPPDARLELDGRPAGRTPVTVTLSSGSHFLRLERTGFNRWVGVLDVSGQDFQAPPTVVLQRSEGDDLARQVLRPEGFLEAPDEVTLATLARRYRTPRVLLARRDGRLQRFPEWTWLRANWGWLVVSGAVAAVAVALAATSSLWLPDPGRTLVLAQ
jgi:hypothetical protein